MYTTGCIKSPKDLRNYKINTATSVEIPESFQLNHTTILDQGNVGSCVAHALASVMESIYGEQFSVGWLYGNRHNYKLNVGMPISVALKTARKLGCVKKEEFDYNVEMTEIYDMINQERERLEPLAEPFKIGSYAILNNITEIKTALLKGIPVIFSASTKDDYFSLTDNVINVTDGEIVGGHAMMIYGWNDKGFLIQNSWGKEWGDNGTAILPYEYPIKEAWAVSKLTIDESADIIKPKLYLIRKIITIIIEFLKNLLKKEVELWKNMNE